MGRPYLTEVSTEEEREGSVKISHNVNIPKGYTTVGFFLKMWKQLFSFFLMDLYNIYNVQSKVKSNYEE